MPTTGTAYANDGQSFCADFPTLTRSTKPLLPTLRTLYLGLWGNFMGRKFRCHVQNRNRWTTFYLQCLTKLRSTLNGNGAISACKVGYSAEASRPIPNYAEHTGSAFHVPYGSFNQHIKGSVLYCGEPVQQIGD